MKSWRARNDQSTAAVESTNYSKGNLVKLARIIFETRSRNRQV